MGTDVLNRALVLFLCICDRLKVSAFNSPTSQSREPLRKYTLILLINILGFNFANSQINIQSRVFTDLTLTNPITNIAV